MGIKCRRVDCGFRFNHRPCQALYPSSITMPAPVMRKLLRLKFIPKPKGSSTDALGWLIDIALSAETALQFAPFPYVQGAATALALVLQCVQRVNQNNGDYDDLISRIKSILQVIQKVAEDSDADMCSRMNDLLEEFEASLREIVFTVKSQRQHNDKWIKQYLRSYSVADSILKLKQKLEDARLNLLVTATFAQHASANKNFARVDQKLEFQTAIVRETHSTIAKVDHQSQTLVESARGQVQLMNKNQSDVMAAFTLQSQLVSDGLRGQDSTLNDQKQLALRQHEEVLKAFQAVKQASLVPSASVSKDDFEEYEENFQVFKQSEWRPKKTLISSDENEGSWMSSNSQVLVIDQASTVGNARYRVRTFKAANYNKPEEADVAFQVFKDHLRLHSSTRMPFLPELVGFSKFKHGPSLFFEEHDEDYVPWTDYEHPNDLSKTLLLFKVNLVEEDARKYMARHMGMHPARNKEGNRIAESVLIGPGGKVKLLGWTSVTRPRVDFTSAAVSLKLLDQDLKLVGERLKKLENREQVLRDFIASGAAFLNIKRRRLSGSPLTDYHAHLGFLYCTCCEGPKSVRARWTPHIHFSVTATHDDLGSTATTELDIGLEPKSPRVHCAKVSIAPGVTTISSILFLQSYEPVDVSIMYHTTANPHHISFEHLSEYSTQYLIRYFPSVTNDDDDATSTSMYLLIHPCLSRYGKPLFELYFECEGKKGNRRMSITPLEAESRGIFIEQQTQHCLFREFSAGKEHFPLLCQHMELNPFEEYYPQALKEHGVSAFDDGHPELDLVECDDVEYGHPSHPSAQEFSSFSRRINSATMLPSSPTVHFFLVALVGVFIDVGDTRTVTSEGDEAQITDPVEECSPYYYAPVTNALSGFPPIWQPASILANDTEALNLWANISKSVPTNIFPHMQAIKLVVGVTPTCWRPPFGDIDDRIRAIAEGLGLITVIWGSDSFDWEQATGNVTADQVYANYDNLITKAENGTFSTVGSIMLTHELNSKSLLSLRYFTMQTAVTMYPQLKAAFQHIVPIGVALNRTQPYVETNYTQPNFEQCTSAF
ncbi:hypothetical protein D9757_011852 [Collybiopsis confluens]|uniref:Chitin deacetylase n=1 Tax=Collybiopsis confluens TaxID=2823264 RepID=A0A8H5FX66_9AGAR|nr:hypothetical protein D9757_011852 [Collybiopsis confluens]